jgi:hypothetical protein
VDKENTMSASSRSIPQSTGVRSILAPLALAAAALVAAVSIAWGAMAFTAAKPAQATLSVVAHPAMIERDTRDDLAQPAAPVVIDRGAENRAPSVRHGARPE